MRFGGAPWRIEIACGPAKAGVGVRIVGLNIEATGISISRTKFIVAEKLKSRF